MSMNTLLLSRLPIEQARCRELLSAYARMGSLGCMGAALVEEALLRADRAIIDGHEAGVERSLAELQALVRLAVPPRERLALAA